MSDVSHSPLGRESEYKSDYDASLLFPIGRAENRAQLAIEGGALPFVGVDLWTGYELSWLNRRGLPQVAIAEFSFPCSSENIIESKSLKLYLNSFNQTRFHSWTDVEQTLAADLSKACGETVDVVVYQLSEFAGMQGIGEPEGICLDQLPVTVDSYNPDQKLLRCNKEQSDVLPSETLYSHLLRSNCPVTGQPDWASIYITYTGPVIDREGLLQYLVSYRQHQDFHEHCVESIFTDIMQHCRPQQLDVYARYTRRGGLDINPWRSTAQQRPPQFRHVRQ